jgi:hypothetical protein
MRPRLTRVSVRALYRRRRHRRRQGEASVRGGGRSGRFTASPTLVPKSPTAPTPAVARMVRQSRSRRPVVRYWATGIVAAAISIFSMLTFLVLYIQGVLGFDALETGLYIQGVLGFDALETGLRLPRTSLDVGVHW